MWRSVWTERLKIYLDAKIGAAKKTSSDSNKLEYAQVLNYSVLRRCKIIFPIYNSAESNYNQKLNHLLPVHWLIDFFLVLHFNYIPE